MERNYRYIQQLRKGSLGNAGAENDASKDRRRLEFSKEQVKSGFMQKDVTAAAREMRAAAEKL